MSTYFFFCRVLYRICFLIVFARGFANQFVENAILLGKGRERERKKSNQSSADNLNRCHRLIVGKYCPPIFKALIKAKLASAVYVCCNIEICLL